ncbi:hypothetical protein Bbelb_206690 [Branchiostoma belcheri]|nr:hypothetical protein Bbelb_206690 [Branchiostoma belcheri]
MTGAQSVSASRQREDMRQSSLICSAPVDCGFRSLMITTPKVCVKGTALKFINVYASQLSHGRSSGLTRLEHAQVDITADWILTGVTQVVCWERPRNFNMKQGGKRKVGDRSGMGQLGPADIDISEGHTIAGALQSGYNGPTGLTTRHHVSDHSERRAGQAEN